MPTFTYKARSKTGSAVDGTVEGTDRRSAVAMVEQMGYVPISVNEKHSAEKASEKKKSAFTMTSSRPARMRTSDVLTFSTELSDLLAAGMTLGNGLNVLSNHETGRGGDTVIPSLRDEILQGASLSDALATHPSSFPSLYVSMIQAGEASGTLTEALRRLVDHYELLQEVKDKVITALVYPAIVVLM